jgi:hypothetical protein
MLQEVGCRYLRIRGAAAVYFTRLFSKAYRIGLDAAVGRSSKRHIQRSSGLREQLHRTR